MAVPPIQGARTAHACIHNSAIIRLLIPATPRSHETMPGNDSAAKRARLPQRGPQPPRFIVIEGPLRVGKTTLARILAERLHPPPIYHSPDHPFLPHFSNATPSSPPPP